MTTDREQLKQALKQLIITECDKDITPDSIGDDDILIGDTLELDSLDALQISMAVKSRYGLTIEGGPAARRILQSVNTLAEAIMNHEPD